MRSQLRFHVLPRCFAKENLSPFPRRRSTVSALTQRIRSPLHFWPGPLTIVAPASAAIPELVRAGLPSVGVRLPAHETARALIRAAGCPIAAPSANLFGQLSPTSAAHVAEQLSGRIHAIVVAEPSRVGVESTVVSLLPGEPARLLRPGGVPRELVERALAPFGPLLGPAAPSPSDAALPAPSLTLPHRICANSRASHSWRQMTQPSLVLIRSPPGSPWLRARR